MNVSEKANTYAAACVDGDIVSESQAPYLARNFQVLIDEYEARIAELEAAIEEHNRRMHPTMRVKVKQNAT